MKRVLNKKQLVEQSIVKKYRKELWAKFIKAIQEYDLINENDKIMVCISGGKDSFLLAKLMEELKKHGKFYFDIKYVCMNPGYSEENINKIIDNAKFLGIDLEIFDSDIFDVSLKLNSENPCYMCARMRRGFLYNKAMELGCNKIALGHHLNDVIETTLLAMFYSSEVKTMMPKLHSDNFEGIELIRPMYLISEKDIINWSKYNELSFLNCACKFTECKHDGKREEIKKLIEELREKNPRIENNVFKSLDNINLNCVLGYKKDNKYNSFLDDYDK